MGGLPSQGGGGPKPARHIRIPDTIDVEVVNEPRVITNISGQAVTTSVSGNIVQISGQSVSVNVSGQTVQISGQGVLISGQAIVTDSGSVTSISGNIVIAKISGESITTNISGQIVQISGQAITTSVSGNKIFVITASGDFVVISGTVFTSVSGNIVQISGQGVLISGQAVVTDSGSVTSVSGNIVQISGQSVSTNISGQSVIAKISGETVFTSVSGNIVQISGQGVLISGQAVVTDSGSVTSVSGNIVQISGQSVSTNISGQSVIAKISGETVLTSVSGNIVQISGQDVNVTDRSSRVVGIVSGNEGQIQQDEAEYNSYIKVMDAPHIRIHEGIFYEAMTVDTGVNIASPKRILFVTGSGKETHFLIDVESEPGSLVEFFEDTVVATSGTVVTTVAHHRPQTSSLTLAFEDITTSGDGTLIFERRSGTSTAGGKVGGKTRRENEFILKTNSKYQLKITPLSNGTAISTESSFYETIIV